MNITIGYIEHNEDVFKKHLGPSIMGLTDKEFEVVTISDQEKPAKNYNSLIEKAKTDWVILTHQDISFSFDFLDRVKETIQFLNSSNIKVGALGLVGPIKDQPAVAWSRNGKAFQFETVDCCMIIINKNNDIWFDEETFDDYHLYVEDYCMQCNEKGLGCYSININGFEAALVEQYDIPNCFVKHHSATVTKRGVMWGRYKEYKLKLYNKYGREVKTT